MSEPAWQRLSPRMLLVHPLHEALRELPLLEGSTWAFVDWMLPDTSGLEICRQIRCAPQTASAHITIILDEDDAEAKRRGLKPLDNPPASKAGAKPANKARGVANKAAPVAEEDDK